MSLVLRNKNLLDDFFGHSFSNFYSTKEFEDFNPKVNLRESEKSYFLEAELAGLKREDVDIFTHEEFLVIKGEKTRSDDSKEDAYHHIERSYGEFERRFKLGKDADRENIKASFENGLLIIEIPKIIDETNGYNKISIS